MRGRWAWGEGAAWAEKAVEGALVFLGVFLGIQADDWQEERVRQETERYLIAQVGVALEWEAMQLDSTAHYLTTARAYAEKADVIWQAAVLDPDAAHRVRAEFAVALHMASEAIGLDLATDEWDTLVGPDVLTSLEDPAAMRQITTLIATRTDRFELEAVSGPYREAIRSIVPIAIKREIQRQCGERKQPDGLLVLPPACEATLAAYQVGATIDAVIAEPRLREKLRWQATHLNDTATLMRTAAENRRRALAALKATPPG